VRQNREPSQKRFTATQILMNHHLIVEGDVLRYRYFREVPEPLTGSGFFMQLRS